MRPSMFSHAINGIFAFVAIVLFFIYYKELDRGTILEILLLIAIACGIHGILHHYEEIYYGFNPLANHWVWPDEVIRSPL